MVGGHAHQPKPPMSESNHDADSDDVNHYRGHTYEVCREQKDGMGTYTYEFNLYVDGLKYTSASKLEARGVVFENIDNWTSELKRHAKSFIDGLEAER